MPDDNIQKEGDDTAVAHESLQRHGEPLKTTDLLLPVPDQEDVVGFITLYRIRYGVEMQPEQAHEILGGLMRFLYLTRCKTLRPSVPANEVCQLNLDG